MNGIEGYETSGKLSYFINCAVNLDNLTLFIIVEFFARGACLELRVATPPRMIGANCSAMEADQAIVCES